MARARPGRVMEQLLLAFSPIVAQKKREFRALHQGNRTVSEYLHEFNHLARYAPEDVRTDVEKQEKFLAGLDDELTNQLISRDYANFEN
uniref:Retrotransposon protein, putative, Ty3-gypsy subclass n=1 Tax=Oryza sativa subsp. japonica TaxID=39947 RepID=Q2QTB4_ORYSJ|nr:retrotransposon protein, putative, Ty3-gypsy subclass [Oryza sativa Japonica Group]